MTNSASRKRRSRQTRNKSIIEERNKSRGSFTTQGVHKLFDTPKRVIRPQFSAFNEEKKYCGG